MKIAFVSQPIDGPIPPPRNSIGIIVYELARHLAENTDVSVFTFGSRLHSGSVHDQGVDYYHLPIFFDSYIERINKKLHNKGDPAKPYYASPWSYPAYAWQIARMVRQKKIDVLHIMNFSQFIPLVRALNPQVKIVLHMECEWLSQLSREIIEPRLASADLVLGCSEFVTKRIKDRFPQFDDRCHTLYNGVDVARFSEDSTLVGKGDGSGDKPTVTFVGRVSPEKGVHVLINAMVHVVKEFPNARLEVIGPMVNVPADYVLSVSNDPIVKDLNRFYGPDDSSLYETHLQDQLRTHLLHDHVQFIGDIPNAQLHERLRSADLLVFPSVWEEPFGIPPVEAMAMGMPVIATRSGGMNETVLHHKTGILVERNDAEDLAAAILLLLKDRKLAKEMGKAGREWAHNTFSYQAVSQQLLRFYQDFCAPRLT